MTTVLPGRLFEYTRRPIFVSPSVQMENPSHLPCLPTEHPFWNEETLQVAVACLLVMTWRYHYV
jgi:hypothetical protein